MENKMTKNKKVYTSYYAFNKSNDITKKRYPSYNVMESVLVENKYTTNTFDEKIKSKFGEINFSDKDESMKKQIIKFYKLIKANEKYNNWFNNASKSDELIRRRTPRNKSSKFDKFFLATIENHLKANQKIPKTLNAKKKANEKAFMEKDDMQIIKKATKMILDLYYKRTGMLFNINKLHISFVYMSKNALGDCFPSSRDIGNGIVKGNKLIHIRLRKNYSDNYNPSIWLDVLKVLVHELGHAIDDCKSGHGKTWEGIVNDMELIKTASNGYTIATKKFNEYYKDVIKLKWNGMCMSTAKTKSKTINYRCLLTKIKRFTITNESALASSIQAFSDCGDNITEEDLINFFQLTGKRLSPMLPYTRKVLTSKSLEDKYYDKLNKTFTKGDE
jgi:hypothetical protein